MVGRRSIGRLVLRGAGVFSESMAALRLAMPPATRPPAGDRAPRTTHWRLWLVLAGERRPDLTALSEYSACVGRLALHDRHCKLPSPSDNRGDARIAPGYSARALLVTT